MLCTFSCNTAKIDITICGNGNSSVAAVVKDCVTRMVNGKSLFLCKGSAGVFNSLGGLPVLPVLRLCWGDIASFHQFGVEFYKKRLSDISGGHLLCEDDILLFMFQQRIQQGRDGYCCTDACTDQLVYSGQCLIKRICAANLLVTLAVKSINANLHFIYSRFYTVEQIICPEKAITENTDL